MSIIVKLTNVKCRMSLILMFYYRPQRSCEGYALHLSVILSTGGGESASVHAGIPPPEADTPLSWGRHPPEQTDPLPLEQTTPAGADTPPPPAPGDGCRCERCASYWNAILLQIISLFKRPPYLKKTST